MLQRPSLPRFAVLALTQQAPRRIRLSSTLSAPRAFNSFVPIAVLVVVSMTLVVTSTMPATATVIIAAVLVTRHVFVVVPVVPHKVDRSAAGVVLRAMLAPVFLVARRHMQVDRRGRNELRRPLDYNGLRVNQLGLRDPACC